MDPLQSQSWTYKESGGNHKSVSQDTASLAEELLQQSWTLTRSTPMVRLNSWILTAAVALYSPAITGCSAKALQSKVLPERLGPTTQIFNVNAFSAILDSAVCFRGLCFRLRNQS